MVGDFNYYLHFIPVKKYSLILLFIVLVCDY